MKFTALTKLRAKLANHEPIYGMMITLESPTITEIAVGLGLDWVIIDAEHGHLDWKEIVEHVRAAVRSKTVVLVRIAEYSAGTIKRCLDIGADGFLVPGIETAAQVRELFTAAQYPPKGRRGIGAERATCWGRCFAEHAELANEQLLIIPIIESVEGIQNIESILQENLAEVYLFGPADLSATAGYPGQWEGPGTTEMISTAVSKIIASGRCCGIFTTGADDILRRKGEGFSMLGLGLDAGLIIRQLESLLYTCGEERRLSPDLLPHDKNN